MDYTKYGEKLRETFEFRERQINTIVENKLSLKTRFGFGVDLSEK